MNILFLLTISFFAGFLPMVCWAVIVWWFDRFEKEPFPLLALSFLWGVIPAVAISLSFESLFFQSTEIAGNIQLFALFQSGPWAPIIEESIKWVGLMGVCLIGRNEIDGPLDGIIYAAMIGFGFAATENTFFFLGSRSLPDFFLLVFLRAMFFGSAHAMFTAFSGIGLILARSARRRWQAFGWAIGGFVFAIFFHWLHNAGMMQLTDSPWLFVLGIGSSLVGTIFIVMLMVGALIRERRTIRTYLYPYVQEGMLSDLQWKTAVSIRARLQSELTSLRTLNIPEYRKISRFYTLCTELAFKEKQRRLFGSSPSLDTQIRSLRSILFENHASMEGNP